VFDHRATQSDNEAIYAGMAGCPVARDVWLASGMLVNFGGDAAWTSCLLPPTAMLTPGSVEFLRSTRGGSA
jgi:hypothetical protein